MPIKNYSTAVSPTKTVGEISTLLVRKGARSIQQEYASDGSVIAVSFTMLVRSFPITFQLPANADGVAAVMLKENPWNYRRMGGRPAYEQRIREQAKWTAWRILKDWIEAQLALIESGQVEAAQVFMPYAIHPGTGLTAWQQFQESAQLQLGAGE